MSNVTAGTLLQALQRALGVVANLDPKLALASAGVDILQEVFGTNSEVKAILNRVMAETEVDAPDVAQAVSDYYTKRSDAVKKSFQDHPGT